MTASAIDPDVGRPLRRALPRMQWATGLDATMAGPVTCGGRRLVVTELHGLLTSTMSGLVATPGMGIGGKALQLGRPAAVNDYLNSTAVSHHFDRRVALEQVRGALAVPVRVGRDIKAVLYGIARTTDPLGDRVLDAAAAVAVAVGRELAVEIEVARRLRAIEAERMRRDQLRVGPEMQEIHEELASVAAVTSDLALRERLLVLCDRLVPPATSGKPLLTARERQVLAAVAVGRTNREVAEELSIMPTTVKTYLKNAMRKLGTRNRVETIHAARCTGLLG